MLKRIGTNTQSPQQPLQPRIAPKPYPSALHPCAVQPIPGIARQKAAHRHFPFQPRQCQPHADMRTAGKSQVPVRFAGFMSGTSQARRTPKGSRFAAPMHRCSTVPARDRDAARSRHPPPPAGCRIGLGGRGYPQAFLDGRDDQCGIIQQPRALVREIIQQGQRVADQVGRRLMPRIQDEKCSFVKARFSDSVSPSRACLGSAGSAHPPPDRPALRAVARQALPDRR